MKQLKDYILTENNFFKNLGVGQVALIKKWLDEYNIKNYTINDDLTIDVKGEVNLRGFIDKKLPDYIQFRNISVCFKIMDCPNLESLEGCPQKVGGNFDCRYCEKLKSLRGCPEEVGASFACNGCSKLTSLEGCPKKVGKSFYCEKCGKKFTITDIEKICKVKGIILV